MQNRMVAIAFALGVGAAGVAGCAQVQTTPLKPVRLYADHCVTPAGPGKRPNPRLRLKAIFGACA